MQIIVTTHSPYLLNREEPSSNILLCRELRRGKAYQTKLVDTAGASWMAPFAEHLGIDSSEFASWRPVFSSFQSRVLLVEGDTDRTYFELFQQQQFVIDGLSRDVDVVAYGGKDTLKNTLLVKFVLSKFDHVFITYDLDAHSEVEKALTRLGLTRGHDFLPLGLDHPGKDCIEGLLPDRVLAAVNGRETGLVMSLGASGEERRKAKDQLKAMYLEEFKKHTDYTKKDLEEFNKAIRTINARFATSKR